MLRTSHTATRAARGRTSIPANHHRYHSRLTRFEPLESRQLLTATVIQVTTTADTVDPFDGFISLREAVLEANASPDDHEIQVPAGTFTLSRQGANEDASLTGDLDIINNGSLKIVGSGSAITKIDAAGLFNAGLGYGDRIFDVKTGAVVELDGLALTGGSPQVGASALSTSGAVRSSGQFLRIANSQISQNTGGGIYAEAFGVIELFEVSVTDNVGSGVAAIGGEISMVSCTVSGNTIFGVGKDEGVLSIAGSTISNNGDTGIGSGGSVTITDSLISGNDGGGVSVTGTSYLLATTISNNGRSGLTAILRSADTTLVDCTIDGNGRLSIAYGGGVENFGKIAAYNTTISNNEAIIRGGGIRNMGSLFLSACTLIGNRAGGGGAIYNESQMTITKSLITENSAHSAGGIMNEVRGSLSLADSTVSSNIGSGGVGGISHLTSLGFLSVRNCTIVANRSIIGTAPISAGIQVTNGQVLIENSLIAGNLRNSSPIDIWMDSDVIDIGSSYNLIGAPTISSGFLNGVNGNIVGDGSGNPIDVSTVLDTTLADNGGPTLTHALVLGSPAINAGNPLFNPNATFPPTLFDQRGAGYGRVFGGRVDMGAYEFGSTFEAVVAGRHIFYDDSVFDSDTAGANPRDLLAIATDKQPLLPSGSLASAANVTSYSGGINGIMIDIAGSHPDITAADFLFHVGNSNIPGSWTAAPAPAGVTILAGQGDAGADRVIITWPSGAIKNTWLELQVLATANTGLATSDVFYWGNKVGDSFTSPGAGLFNTTSTDAAQVFAMIGNSKPIADLRDYNRDGSVNSTDAAIVYANIGSLVRISIAPPVPFQAAPSAAAVDGRSAVASGLGQRGVSKTTDSLPSVDSLMRNETYVTVAPQEIRVAVTSDPHFEALSAASDSLEDILFEVDNELFEPVLAELI